MLENNVGGSFCFLKKRKMDKAWRLVALQSLDRLEPR